MKTLKPKRNILLFFVCSFFLFFAENCTKPNSENFFAQPSNSEDELQQSKPNIILILGDDIGYEVPTYTGGQSYSTPNIDYMAANGLQFTHCNGSPMCTPSRFMLLTGKYNFRNYFQDSWGNLGLDQRTIANMLKSAGYKTCATGKWQLNNGDIALKTFGFDRYSVTYPTKETGNESEDEMHIYKDPSILQDGAFLPKEKITGKYSEDLQLNYMFNFIDSNKNNPFFMYWAPNLCHKPFGPTPDDPAFATWDPNKLKEEGDTIYFPSMIKYFDKNIGKLLAKLQSLNLQQKTIILFLVGDNGTDYVINSLYKGKYIHGGKGKSTDAGIHLPFIAYMPGTILPSVNNDMIDFVDFLPTIAKIAKTPLPKTFGTLDGINFYPQLLGASNSKARTYAYCWYNVNRRLPDTIPATAWSLDATYKFYDSTDGIYNYPADPSERKLISGSKRTPLEVQAQANLQNYINSFK